MARRTIRARRASPYQLYLLIAFILIAVTFGVLFAWIINVKGGLEINVFGTERIEEAKVQKIDLWAELFDKYPGATNLVDLLESKTRLVTEYETEIHRLLERITGDPFATQSRDELRATVTEAWNSSGDLLAQTTETLRTSYPVLQNTQEGADIRPQSLQSALRALMVRVESMRLQVRQDNTAIKELEGRLAGVQSELAAAKQEHARQVAQLESQLADEKARLALARDNAIAQAARFKEELERLQDRFIAFKRESKTERDSLERNIMTQKNTIQDLAEVVEEIKVPPTETGVDGRIIRIGEMGGVAYVDIGRKDGVLLGMTFSVFSARELGTQTPQKKADVRVVRLMEDAAEVRIYNEGRSPVIVGDLLFNPIYDRARRLGFRLVGKMDLDGDGLDDTERIKALIQRFGGKVEDRLTVKTDFLVLGEEPEVGPAPGADAGPMERQLYEENRKAFIQYSTEKAQAEDYSIPILSLNRFIGLLGISDRVM